MLFILLHNIIPHGMTSRFGNLPCLDRIQENDTPGSVVAKLFASAKRSGKEYGVPSHCLQNWPSEAQMRVCITPPPCLSDYEFVFCTLSDFYFVLGNDFWGTKSTCLWEKERSFAICTRRSIVGTCTCYCFTTWWKCMLSNFLVLNTILNYISWNA
jgi:hypothetical protein